MAKRKLIIIGLVILLLIDLGLAYQSWQTGNKPEYSLVSIEKGSIVETVSATGTVKPASQIDLQFTSSGKVVDVKVEAGDRVSAGQILASLDSGDLFYQAQNAEASLQAARARLAQLLAGASAQDIALVETAVVNAEKNLEDAKKSLTDAEASAQNSLDDVYEDAQRTIESSLLTAQNAIKANEETLDSTKLSATLSVLDSQTLIDAKNLRTIAELYFENAEISVSNLKTNFSQANIDEADAKLKTALNSIYSALGRTYDSLAATITSSGLSQTDLDTFKLTISTHRSNANTALTNLVSAQQNIASQKIINQTNLNASQAKVTQAEGQLQTAQDQLTLKKALPRQADIDLYQAQVKQAEATLNQTRYQISQKSLTAPIEGIVTNVAIEKGETASLSQVAISMNSLSNFEIESNIAESDIAKVSLGQKVEITFDAFIATEKWEGKIIKIDPAETIIQGVVYYKTIIGLSSNDERVRPGMTANLEIETARKENALILPRNAVKESNGRKFIQILDSKEIKEKEIETGLKDAGGNIEIISGLKEGDKVVIEKKK